MKTALHIFVVTVLALTLAAGPVPVGPLLTIPGGAPGSVVIIGIGNRIDGTEGAANRATTVWGESNVISGSSAHGTCGNFRNVLHNGRYGVCFGWDSYVGHPTIVISNNAVLSGWENTSQSPNSVVVGGYL